MIRGTKRPVPHRRQTIDLRASIHNRFDVEVIDVATGELKQKAQAFNVICEGLWDQLFNGTTDGHWKAARYFNYILFGKGSGTPVASDAALFSQLGYKTANRSEISVDRRTGVSSYQAVATLEANEYVGETLTEVGIGYDTTHCATHALLQDMNGNPISITKTDTDVIKIYATVFVHWPADGWYNGSINTTSGYGYTTHGFLRFLSGYSGSLYGAWVLGWANSRVNRNNIGDTVSVYPTVSRANKTYTLQFRVPAASMNRPIRYFLLSCDSSYSNDGVLNILPGSWFSPPTITGEAVGTGDGSAVAFNTAFPVRSGATVYVDGVAASGVTVRGGPVNASRMEQWFDPLFGIDAADGALTVSGNPIYNEAWFISDYFIPIGQNAGDVSPVFLNPFYAQGLASFQARSHNSDRNGTVAVQASDDCINWSTAVEVTNVPPYSPSENYADYSVPAAHKNKKYWRFTNTGSKYVDWEFRATAAVADTTHNIVFDTPPAAGAVITCDYVPDCIAKDSDHVFDLTLVLTLGEYQE